MQIHELKLPDQAESIGALRAGQRVRLSGQLVTARCRVHKALLDGLNSPIKLEGAAIIHSSPVIVRDGAQWVVRALGPSGSALVDAYVPPFIERYRVRVIIGMGSLGDATRRACERFGCVYLQTVGGVASKQAETIRSVAGVHFLREFGAADAMWVLEVEGLEALVAIDTSGRSLHRRVQISSRRAMARLLA